jgi:hypothetical protein
MRDFIGEQPNTTLEPTGVPPVVVTLAQFHTCGRADRGSAFGR